MKEIKRRELELLAKKCNENSISLKLAKDLLKTAEQFTYENHSQGARVKEYHSLVSFHSKKS